MVGDRVRLRPAWPDRWPCRESVSGQSHSGLFRVSAGAGEAAGWSSWDGPQKNVSSERIRLRPRRSAASSAPSALAASFRAVTPGARRLACRFAPARSIRGLAPVGRCGLAARVSLRSRSLNSRPRSRRSLWPRGSRVASLPLAQFEASLPSVAVASRLACRFAPARSIRGLAPVGRCGLAARVSLRSRSLNSRPRSRRSLWPRGSRVASLPLAQFEASLPSVAVASRLACRFAPARSIRGLAPVGRCGLAARVSLRSRSLNSRPRSRRSLWPRGSRFPTGHRSLCQRPPVGRPRCATPRSLHDPARRRRSRRRRTPRGRLRARRSRR